MSKVSDLHGKRKYAGPPIAELRKTEGRDKRHLSPHEKPRTWTLTIEWTETTTFRREKKFTTRAARDESRRRVERHFRETAAKVATESPKRYRRSWSVSSPFADYTDEQISKIKEGPQYVETSGEESQSKTSVETAGEPTQNRGLAAICGNILDSKP